MSLTHLGNFDLQWSRHFCARDFWVSIH